MLTAALVPLATLAVAQVSTVPAPSPVQTAPLAPPPGAAATPETTLPQSAPTPAPAQAPVQAPLQIPAPAIAPPPVPPSSSQQATPDSGRDTTLAGTPGDPMNVDALVLTAKPALTISGQSTWDKGFETLSENFRRLETEAGRLGLKIAGRPITYFVETDDMGFRFDAMLPVDRAADGTAPAAGIRAGQTPQGNALRFTHKGPYEDVDTTYEGITAYLDAKGVIVRDQFIEEYVNDPKDASDPGTEVNIYVQPR